ncbi:MAG TPA: EAL domain-containing protein [Burkholderiales bacterium]|nr:EAL domain-containing protein [Burkholderiales bacterium]
MTTTAAPTIRILLTEDVGPDAELELRELKRAGLRVRHRLVDSEQSFERALREFAPDVILSDFSMPGFDGMAALAMARELSPDTPFIFVSGTIGEEYAIRALKSGATDYVLKANLMRLPAAVERAIAEAQERRARRRTEVELDLARERLTSIFTALPDALWSVDAKTRRYLYVSPAAKTIFGLAPDELMAHPQLQAEVVHPADRPVAQQAWERLEQDGEFDVDYRIVRPGGKVRWINNRARLIRGVGGAPERIDGLARDITEQVEHRVRIIRLSRIREFTSSINSTLVRQREREQLASEVCRIAVDVGGFSTVQIGLLDPASQDVIWLASKGMLDDAALARVQVSARADLDAGRGIAGRSLRSGEPEVWNDIANDPGVHERELFLAQGTYSVASFPLLIEGKAVGVFALHAAETGFFDRDEIALLRELAANIAFALELLEKQDRIAYLALYDPLTGLPNRTLFHERLTQAISGKEPLALALIDLERFKAINDTLGRPTGDRVLQAAAARLKQAAGDINRVARLGSNLFALMFDRIGGAEEVARQIEAGARTYLDAALEFDGREVRLAARAGIAVFPADGADVDALFRNAEAALKRAKETGERYLFYAPEINARVSEQVELEHRLRKAVDQGELYLHFQPKFDLATRKLVGVEALMRWRAPDGALVSPAKFVPVLEQTGLILEAGHQVLAAAKRTHLGWKTRGLDAPRIAVNVSALQLRRRSFVADVRAALGEIGADGGGVDLELTESLLMTEVDESIAKLRALRELGLLISLDDFGTGYSSLAYLSKLPLDTLKIDRSFVHAMTETGGDTSIISTIISLAQSLRLKVVAEGVETEQQAQLLRLLRCDQVQGFLFGPPVPAEEIEKLI